MGFFVSESGDEYQGDGNNPDGSLSMDVQPGQFAQLPAGVDFKSYDPQHPSTAFQRLREGNAARYRIGPRRVVYVTG
jgi:capsid protein